MRITKRAGPLTCVAAVVLLLATVPACGPGALSIGADPSLFPAFSPSVTEYVNRCSNRPTKVRVAAQDGTTVSIDGRRARSGRFTIVVRQAEGDRFTIRIRSGGGTTTHHVRCLPGDFPTWRVTRNGSPQAQYYATMLIEDPFGENYGVLFDRNGVPLWWTRWRVPSFLLTLLPNGHLALGDRDGPVREVALDGAVVRRIAASSGPTDFHDVAALPDGGYAVATAEVQRVDLTDWGGARDTPVLNHVVEVVDASGTSVWSWDTASHIPVTETTPTWRDDVEFRTGLRDPWHINSIEWIGDGFLLSYRNLDAVYKVAFPSGEIIWKLGGIRTPRSLSVVRDPVVDGGGGLSGQHDARRLPDGTVTLFDNGSQVGRAPRALRYRIDPPTGTATLIESVVQSPTASSPCCGSSRRLNGGNWVIGWGGSEHITESREDGTRVFQLRTPFVYQAVPIAPGRLTSDALRSGMDTQYSR